MRHSIARSRSARTSARAAAAGWTQPSATAMRTALTASSHSPAAIRKAALAIAALAASALAGVQRGADGRAPQLAAEIRVAVGDRLDDRAQAAHELLGDISCFERARRVTATSHVAALDRARPASVAGARRCAEVAKGRATPKERGS